MDMHIQKKNQALKNAFLGCKIIHLVFLFFFSSSLFSQQNINVFGEGSLMGIISSENEIPYWFYNNSSTRVGEYTNGSLYGKFISNYNWKETNIIEVGLSVVLRDGVSNYLQRENLYIDYRRKWLKVTVGAKERPILFNGLSSTNGNMIWSLNARPLPGIIFEANNPIHLSKTFSIDWGIAHYSLNDDRYVDNVRVHYKRIGLNVTINEKNKLTARMQHFAMWAGTSPEYGQLPNDFETFIRVFFARKGSDSDPEGEIQNAVGDHVGSYFIDYSFKSKFGKITLYHEHPFEDGSGTRLSNFPDGVWGGNYIPKSKKIITSFLYEYVDTTDQSGSSGTSGRDGYFSSFLYKSGWTYEGNIIGTPFITADNSIDLEEFPSAIDNNRTISHHLGFKGEIKKIEWIFKTTLIKYLGTYGKPFNPIQKKWYNYLSVSYTTTKYGKIILQTGLDFSNVANTLFGAGLSYSYAF